MTKIKKMSAKLVVCILMFTMLTTGGLNEIIEMSASALVESVDGSDSLVRTSLTEINSILTTVVYSDYKALYADVKDAEKTVTIDLAAYVKDEKSTTATVEEKAEGYESSDGFVLLTADDGKVSWNVEIEEEALYSIQIEYYTGDITVVDAEGNTVSTGKSSAFERMILIDGKIPFKESRSIVLEREWVDEYTVVDENGKAILDENGNEQKYLSNSDEFIELITKYENNTAESKRLYLQDTTGNEVKPEKTLFANWNSTYIYDSTGYYEEPLEYYLSKGTHMLTLDAIKEPMAIKSITLLKADSTMSYEEYLTSHSDAKNYVGDNVTVIQAEYTNVTSERTLYQLNDRSSTITQPQDPAKQKLNSIGGDKWQYVGQWMEWTVVVEESGFYDIIPRSKQDLYSGMYVSRKLYINGEVPFKEAACLRFNYSDEWLTESLNDGEQDFKFYLEAGVKNTIRLEVVLGDMAEILSTIEKSLTTINGYYRKILMITGPDPDEYRDYYFQRLIPDVVKGLKEQSTILQAQSDRLAQITGEKGEHSATLDKIAVYLNRMGTYTDTIAASMSTLKDYLAALGTWLTDTQNQPLCLDYICIQSVDAEAPEAEPGFFEAFWGELQKFWMSFFADYNSIGSMTESGITSADLEAVSIEVWTATSREQAQIIRSLVDDNFSSTYNIPVEVKLVVGGTLLPATLAGTGPDVSMGSGQGDPVNYAIRSAVKSLNTLTGDKNVGYNFNDLSTWADNPIYSQFLDEIDTFDTVTERFADAAMIPITLYGETYAIPETMNFPMMFYRKDIFAELGVEVPNTWEDFYDIIYTLQANMLDMGVLPGGIAHATTLMYQQNEQLYNSGNYDYYMNLYKENGYTDEQLAELGYTYTNEEGVVIPKTDGMKINLDSDLALATFKEECELFTVYDFPYSYNLATRFRQGIMPIAIADYSGTYNTLIVFAPEIKGLWEFTPIPGTPSEDGTINNTTVASISAMVMMRSVTEENALAAWTFMQWWTNAEIQSEYGNEMVALLGPSAKQATANLEALSSMSWSKDEYDNLIAQFNAVTCLPEYPGGYIISRYTQFAFLDVYNENAEPVDTMLSYINDINSELSRKRQEFGLPTIDSFEAFENNTDGDS